LTDARPRVRSFTCPPPRARYAGARVPAPAGQRWGGELGQVGRLRVREVAGQASRPRARSLTWRRSGSRGPRSAARRQPRRRSTGCPPGAN
jgi:hypothetical protein